MSARIRWGALPVALLATGVFAASAVAAPGPKLQEPQARLDAALRCSPDVDSAKRMPVLLVPGTGATPENNYSWNYMKVLPREGHPVCTLTYRDRGMLDLQIQVEYVVNAIRRVAARSSRKIAVIGHSQGAILNSYALRFWPDLARKVEDFIGVAGTYTYGTGVAQAVCTANCAIPLLHEIKPGSAFMAAMARTPLPAGPGYTTYATRTDEAIWPQPKAGILEAPGTRNHMLQDLCPTDLYEHDTLVGTAATVALTLDALAHPGPASADRLSPVPCGLIREASSSVQQVPDLLLGTIGAGPGGDRSATSAPPLRCYLDPTCPKPRLQPVLVAKTTQSPKRRAPLRFATAGALELPEGALRQCTGSVNVAVRQGRRMIRRGTAALVAGTAPTDPDCRFATHTTVPRGVRGALRVVVRYTGSDELLATRAPRQTVRAGR